jgi:hypothetical protein
VPNYPSFARLAVVVIGCPVSISRDGLIANGLQQQAEDVGVLVAMRCDCRASGGILGYSDVSMTDEDWNSCARASGLSIAPSAAVQR